MNSQVFWDRDLRFDKSFIPEANRQLTRSNLCAIFKLRGFEFTPDLAQDRSAPSQQVEILEGPVLGKVVKFESESLHLER